MNDHRPPGATPDRKTRGAIGIALAGVGVSALAGAAMGFEHTVAVARAYGAPAYWDIVTAASVEVLAITGTALLYVSHRLGWPTNWPYRVIMLGSVLTLGAQLLWFGNDGQAHTTADPKVLGYVVAALPSAVTLILIAIGHAALGYADHDPAPLAESAGEHVPEPAPSTPVPLPAPLPTPGSVPTPTHEPVPTPISPAAISSRAKEPTAPTPAPAGRPVATTWVASTPDTPVQAAVRKTLEVVIDAAEADQLKIVKDLPAGKTGKPSVDVIRKTLKVGQTKAQELRDKAFPASSEGGKEKEKILKVEENGEVTEGNSGAGKSQGTKSEEKEKSTGTNTTSVDQGSDRPAAGPEPTPLRVVGGGRS